MSNTSATKKAQLRKAAYATGSGLLKILSIYGIVDGNELMAASLVLSGLLDLALLNVKVGGEKLNKAKQRRPARQGR
jgi:hypothetical protein